MRIAVLGRTRMLLDAAHRVAAAGHEIPLVLTCRADPHSGASPDDFRRLAQDHGAAFAADGRINAPDRQDMIRAARCDMGISINWLTLIHPSTLALFPRGILNAHAGDLPRFRGNACPNWAILTGEPRVGLCIHEMAQELDAGPVLLRDHFPLSDSTYISEVIAWLDRQVPALLAEAVEQVATGQARPQPQAAAPEASLRCYPRRPEDGLIDWAMPASRIRQLIRATSLPYPGAFTYLEGTERVTIWRAEPWAPPGPFLAVPGQICLPVEGDPVVACLDGMLRLTDISLDGLGEGIPAKRRLLGSLRNRLGPPARSGP